jgi:hypothetical protein
MVVAGLTAMSKPADAQTDYYNLDAGRPVRIEDAYAKERYAFELTVPSLKLARSGTGIYQWSAEPEIAYGILPRTHVKLGVPLVANDDESGRQLGVAGIEAGLFYNLNAETTLPAVAFKASLVIPAGNLAPEQIHPTVGIIATRSFTAARLHLNADYTFGAASGEGAAHDISRWVAGLAVDKALPLRSLLLVADMYAAQPVDEQLPVSWNAEAGLRYQLNPALAMDAGLGKALHGGDQGWFVTFGTAYAFRVRSLIPVRR